MWDNFAEKAKGSECFLNMYYKNEPILRNGIGHRSLNFLVQKYEYSKWADILGKARGIALHFGPKNEDFQHGPIF